MRKVKQYAFVIGKSIVGNNNAIQYGCFRCIKELHLTSFKMAIGNTQIAMVAAARSVRGNEGFSFYIIHIDTKFLKCNIVPRSYVE